MRHHPLSSPSRFSIKWRPPFDDDDDARAATVGRERAMASEERLAAAGRIANAVEATREVEEAAFAKESIVVRGIWSLKAEKQRGSSEKTREIESK